MADTQRPVATILALLGNNTTGDISPQDLRDAFVSWRNAHGQLYVTTPTATTISDTTNYFETVEPTWALSSGAHLWDESGGNGRLTYTGTAPMTCHVAASVSFTVAGVNDIVHLRIGKNATADPASEASRFVSTGADVGSTALHLITSVSTGDYLSLWVRNESGTDNVTLQYANLQVVSMLI